MRCIYCGETKMQEPGSFFQFQDRCAHCGTVYDREEGYYSGVPWMISYPLGSLLGILAAVLLAQVAPGMNTTLRILSICSVAVLIILGSYPWAKITWVYFDHRFNPPDPDPQAKL